MMELKSESDELLKNSKKNIVADIDPTFKSSEIKPKGNFKAIKNYKTNMGRFISSRIASFTDVLKKSLS